MPDKLIANSKAPCIRSCRPIGLLPLKILTRWNGDDHRRNHEEHRSQTRALIGKQAACAQTPGPKKATARLE